MSDDEVFASDLPPRYWFFILTEGDQEGDLDEDDEWSDVEDETYEDEQLDWLWRRCQTSNNVNLTIWHAAMTLSPG